MTDAELNEAVYYMSIGSDVQPAGTYAPYPHEVIDACIECDNWFADITIDPAAPAGYTVTEWHAPHCSVWTIDAEDEGDT